MLVDFDFGEIGVVGMFLILDEDIGDMVMEIDRANNETDLTDPTAPDSYDA